jgi:hypothetical protein
MRESDLYGPVRSFLEERGWSVQAEVGHCDLTARRGEELLVVELKLRLGMELLRQAVRRQRVCDSVYVCVPGPLDCGPRWRDTRRLLRRLELGLIIVTLEPAPRVEIPFHPLPFRKRRDPVKRRALIREIDGRSGSRNTGGVSRTKIVTAYREGAIRVACALERFGPLSPRALRLLGCGDKTSSMLNSNFYAWFERIDRGVYDLTAAGRASLVDYAEVAQQHRSVLPMEIPENKRPRSNK